MTEFPRIENELKLCYSKILDCNISFDTGSSEDMIPSQQLEIFRKRGFVIEEVETKAKLTFSDSSSKFYNRGWRIPIPISFDLWYRGVFFETQEEHLILGLGLLKKHVMVYHHDKIILQEDHPEEFNLLVPLIEKDGRYYIKLSINGRENDYYLDTGHSDAVTLPLEDKQYAISPLREENSYMTLANGAKRPYRDIIEDRGLLEIGGISKHGPIDYADYFDKPYWFNPVFVFSDFMIDLKNKVLGLIKK